MKDLATANREAIHNDDRNQPPEEDRPKPRRKLISNPEALAMDAIDAVLSELSEPAQDRVLAWVNSVYARPVMMPEAK